MAHPTDGSDPWPQRRYGFVWEGWRLVVAAGVLTELVADAQVFPVPRAAPALLGMMNLRGSVVPVFDVQRLTQGHSTDIRPQLRRVLVFGRDTDSRGALVLTGTPELLTLRPPTVGPLPAQPPAGRLSPFLRCAWQASELPESLWWELDHHAVFHFLGHAVADAGAVTPSLPTPALPIEVTR